MKNLFNIKSKIALITGGSRGIGKAITLMLIEQGCRVIVVGKSNNIDELKEEVQISYGADLDYIQCDLSDQKDVDILCKNIKDRYDKIDILVNCAGNQEREFFINYSLDQWNKDIQLLLTSNFQLSQCVSRIMIKNKMGGKIINVGSLSSLQAARNIVGYSVSKGALINLTKCIAIELAEYGINVNLVAPGFFNTELLNKFSFDKERIEHYIPLGKIAEPKDILGTILWLCSDASSYVTGTVIPIDAGWTAKNGV